MDVIFIDIQITKDLETLLKAVTLDRITGKEMAINIKASVYVIFPR